MLKQTILHKKNTLVIFLVFFILISMTISSVNAMTQRAIIPNDTILHIVAHGQDIQTLKGNMTHQGFSGPVLTVGNFDLENPQSLACVYNVTARNTSEPSGCLPYYTNTTPNGGAGAIAIVLPYNYSTAATDLQLFSSYYGLPQANFQVIYATGNSWPYITNTPPTTTWQGEGEPGLDLQWSHAMAPRAKLFLVEPNSFSYEDLSKAEQAAQYLVSNNGGGEISHSWYNMSFTQSQINQFDQIFNNASYPNVINLAASGDYGWPSYPASSPYVIAVGGTTINRNATTGGYLNEKAWNDTYEVYNGEYAYSDPEWGTTDSGSFIDESLPAYQNIPSVRNSVGTMYRGIPDVSIFTTSNGPGSNGADFGVPIVLSGKWVGPYAGTSLSSPLTAGLLNSINVTNLYSRSTIFTALYNNLGSNTNCVRDITLGTTKDMYNLSDNNQDLGNYIDPNAGKIYHATTGYDNATGWGCLLGNGTYYTAPTVTGINPNSGPITGGTSVTIIGTNLGGATAVHFGSSVATITSNSASQIVATSPPGTGTVNVTVTTLGGTSATSSADIFTYGPPSAPTVTGINPNSGPAAGGTSVTINGTNLGNALFAQFGTAIATITSDSASQIVTTSPPEMPGWGTGTVNVTVTTLGGTSATSSADIFTYGPPSAPTVTSINPNSGPAAGGTSVTINGTNLGYSPTVKFGSSLATINSIQTNNAVTQIIATSPPGTGTVNITVTTLGGTSATSSADIFTYGPPSAPTVTGINPNSGPAAGGTSVTINGTNLGGATAAHFGSSVATITSNSASQIVATSPPGTGTVNVTVTTPGGTSPTLAADQYTYIAPPPSALNIAFSIPTSNLVAGKSATGTTTYTVTPA